MQGFPEFYMSVPLGPDGSSSTEGPIDYSTYPALLGVEDADLTGMRVLDIATQDGFWAFWAEERGAREVVALDVDSIYQMDWSPDGPGAAAIAQYRSNSLGWTDTTSGFWFLHEQRKSSVTRVSMSVYELEPGRVGTFDLVFMYGLLYHLRHPLYALDRIRAVTLGSLLLETHVVTTHPNLPHSVFYADDVCVGDHTNWVGPTPAQVNSWVRSAGFPHIRSGIVTEASSPIARQVLIGSLDEDSARVHDDSQLPVVTQSDFSVYREEIDNLLRRPGQEQGN